MLLQSAPAPARSQDAVQIEVLAPVGPDFAKILSPVALRFLAKLAAAFEPQRRLLLERRRVRQQELDAGLLPDFLGETREIRQNAWTVAPIPDDLQKRKVEITGPVDRKMIINALNSGADVFMADFEDSNSPTWENCVGGQVNLVDAVRRQITFLSPEGKTYQLNDKAATLMVRPRGWHLDEKHVFVGGKPISASLFDFGLYFFHNARELMSRGTGPYFYLPKLESHLEARLWNDVFEFVQDELGIPRGTIRATVLIETILAAFEMDEILYELREHSAGLNCGRWDYIFSMIKKFRAHPKFLLSDRALVTMTTPFMRNYTLLTIKTCHRRGIHAIGGMAAQIPIKNNPELCAKALDAVREDKKRESEEGHDGTWVAHPGLVEIATGQFARIPGANQIHRTRCDVKVSADQLLRVPEVPRVSEQGIRTNIAVGIQYLESWLRGQGCVPINNLMEDAATAEISRAQLWQWCAHHVLMTDGRTVTTQLIERLMEDELEKMRKNLGNGRFNCGRFYDARDLFLRMTRAAVCPEFLTQAAYELL